MHDYASKEHVVSALRKGVRLDGRKLDEFRPIEIDTDAIKTAEGGCKLTCGDTIVLAGVKMATGTPYSDKPDSGVLIVNAEMLPMSNPAFESGPPSIESIETSRVIDRGIRESEAIDSKKLCITPGELVWLVNVDICPLNTDGNLIDMGSLASLCAMLTARMPKLEDGKVNYKEQTKEKLPVTQQPVPVTVFKIEDILFVDPTFDELQLVDSRLTVTTLEDGSICAMQKGGEGSLTVDDVEQMIELSIKKAKELRAIVKKAVK